jgi:organic solute transporter subunit alpha
MNEAERRRFAERKVFRPMATTCVLIVITLFPMCSLVSLMSLLSPRNTALLLLAARVYEAVALFAFFELLLCSMGNPEEAIQTMEQQEPFKIYGMPPLCCCYPCVPRLRMTRDRFMFARTLVLQYCVVGPLSYLFQALNSGYVPLLGGAEPENLLARHFMHNGLKIASTLLCFWGLMQLYVATREQLQDLNTTRKFALIKAMLVLTEMVNLGVTFAKTKMDLSDDPVYTEEVMANAWIQMTTCLLIAPLACLLPSAFPESDLAWLEARALLWPQELSKQRIHQVL